MVPSNRTNPLAILVLAVIGVFGLALAGVVAWFVLIWFPRSQSAFTMYTTRGNMLYEQGDYQGAIQEYSRAIQASPRRSRGYALRGDAYYNIHAYRKALADYDRVTKYATLNATKRIVYYNRGCVIAS